MSEYVSRSGRLERPIHPQIGSIDIELTERCDNDCVHCSINLAAGDVVAREREMSTAQVLEILGQAAELGCLSVRFTGGEPLLRPDFEELYLSARNLGLRVLIYTNARRISGHLADLFAATPPLLPVEVTVYGMHRDSYEAVSRVPGSFSQFRRGVDLLLKRGVPFVVKGAFLPQTRDETEELRAWAKTIPSMDSPVGTPDFLHLRCRRDDTAKNRAIESLRPDPEVAAVLNVSDVEGWKSEMVEFAAKFMGPQGDCLFSCGAGKGVAIDAYGRVQPCLGLRDPSLTVDTRTSSLRHALEQFQDLCTVRAKDPEYLRRCAKCFLAGFCDQCPAVSWIEHGVLDKPVDYLCEVAHTRARLLGWLREGENAWEVSDWQQRVSAGIDV